MSAAASPASAPGRSCSSGPLPINPHARAAQSMRGGTIRNADQQATHAGAGPASESTRQSQRRKEACLAKERLHAAAHGAVVVDVDAMILPTDGLFHEGLVDLHAVHRHEVLRHQPSSHGARIRRLVGERARRHTAGPHSPRLLQSPPPRRRSRYGGRSRRSSYTCASQQSASADTRNAPSRAVRVGGEMAATATTAAAAANSCARQCKRTDLAAVLQEVLHLDVIHHVGLPQVHVLFALQCTNLMRGDECGERGALARRHVVPSAAGSRPRRRR
eukprot:scaffold5321_cov366-Prasinococcus_capsulatus_cf.AAC.8